MTSHDTNIPFMRYFSDHSKLDNQITNCTLNGVHAILCHMTHLNPKEGEGAQIDVQARIVGITSLNQPVIIIGWALLTPYCGPTFSDSDWNHVCLSKRGK